MILRLCVVLGLIPIFAARLLLAFDLVFSFVVFLAILFRSLNLGLSRTIALSHFQIAIRTSHPLSFVPLYPCFYQLLLTRQQ